MTYYHDKVLEDISHNPEMIGLNKKDIRFVYTNMVCYENDTKQSITFADAVYEMQDGTFNICEVKRNTNKKGKALEQILSTHNALTVCRNIEPQYIKRKIFAWYCDDKLKYCDLK